MVVLQDFLRIVCRFGAFITAFFLFENKKDGTFAI